MRKTRASTNNQHQTSQIHLFPPIHSRTLTLRRRWPVRVMRRWGVVPGVPPALAASRVPVPLAGSRRSPGGRWSAAAIAEYPPAAPAAVRRGRRSPSSPRGGVGGRCSVVRVVVRGVVAVARRRRPSSRPPGWRCRLRPVLARMLHAHLCPFSSCVSKLLWSLYSRSIRSMTPDDSIV